MNTPYHPTSWNKSLSGVAGLQLVYVALFSKQSYHIAVRRVDL
jgi:hypothetical protein